MIAIIDYGLGNVSAFVNIYDRLGIPARSVATIKGLESASHFILPGVGSFDTAIDRLNASGLRDVLEKRVMTDNVPILGVCVGMQLLGLRSEEGIGKGLGWIRGHIKNFRTCCDTSETRKFPHVGWNTVAFQENELSAVNPSCMQRFYFLHSFIFVPENDDHVIATTFHECNFASALKNENIFGVQFHPEKSHQQGVELLKNFGKI